MESSHRLDTVIGVLLAIAFGVYCLYSSTLSHHRYGEVDRKPTYKTPVAQVVNLGRGEATARH